MSHSACGSAVGCDGSPQIDGPVALIVMWPASPLASPVVVIVPAVLLVMPSPEISMPPSRAEIAALRATLPPPIPS